MTLQTALDDLIDAYCDYYGQDPDAAVEQIKYDLDQAVAERQRQQGD